MDTYKFYYDESEHSRKINYNTVTAPNYYDNFVTVVVGWSKEKEKEVFKKYEEFENKYLLDYESVLYTGCGSELCGAGAGMQGQKRRSFKEKKTCIFGNWLHLCFCGMSGRSPAYSADVSAACLKLCVDLVEPAGREWMDREKTVVAKRDNRKRLLACLWYSRLSGKCSVA